jgi:hypothetical protein
MEAVSVNSGERVLFSAGHVAYLCVIFNCYFFLLQDSKGPKIWQVTMHTQGNLCWWMDCWPCYSGSLFSLYLFSPFIYNKKRKIYWSWFRNVIYFWNFICIYFALLLITSIILVYSAKFPNILIFTLSMVK